MGGLSLYGTVCTVKHNTLVKDMLIAQKIMDKLKANWGEKADALDCYVEVKLIDPISSWCCYVFAMDENEEMINCILYSDAIGPEIYTQCISDIYSMYNEHGGHPVIDQEFRRMRVVNVLRRLKGDT